MIEIVAAMAGVAGSLKSASEIVKTLMETHDGTVVRTKIIELSGQIMSAQSSALSAQTDQFALLERVRALEKEIADFEAWDTQKVRYKLHAIDRGAFAYVLKESMSEGEPPHWLCAKCFTERKKGYLNRALTPSNTGLYAVDEQRWSCAACSTVFLVNFAVYPQYVTEEATDAST